MLNNQFSYSELHAFITGKASTAMARNLQRKFVAAGVPISIEQWSVLYSLWKKDGQSQQELSLNTFKDKPSITRLVDNLEKVDLVVRKADPKDRRINKIFLTEAGKQLQTQTIELANDTLMQALIKIDEADLQVAKKVLQIVYENLK
jgi:DNA-binding MarR family transcriptional regulator